MKWIRFTLETHTDAVDILSYMLDEIGVEGIEIEDHIPLTWIINALKGKIKDK